MALNSYWQRLTGLDRFIVVVLLTLCVLVFIALGLRSPGQSVQVRQNQETLFNAPLAEDRSVELQGPLGVTRLEIANGQARIVASPCPYKVCIGMGEIHRQGEIIACVPNRLLVQVVGQERADKEKAYDLLSR